jgi:hypothetical protein
MASKNLVLSPFEIACKRLHRSLITGSKMGRLKEEELVGLSTDPCFDVKGALAVRWRLAKRYPPLPRCWNYPNFLLCSKCHDVLQLDFQNA